jgi:alpha-tubulin suppressor-like RCC1 family protein
MEMTLDTDIVVLAWGSGSKGQLGFGDESDFHTPVVSAELTRFVRTTHHRHIVVHGGGCHTLVFDHDSRQVIGVGWNEDAQLVHPPSAMLLDVTSIPLPQVPSTTANRPKIAAGWDFSVFVDGL